MNNNFAKIVPNDGGYNVIYLYSFHDAQIKHDYGCRDS